MPVTVYDYVDESGTNTIKEWAKSLHSDRALFESKVNMLRTAGFDLPPKLLSKTRSAHIYKFRFFGKAGTQWRPMLCRGPINKDVEATLLLGAHEKGSKLIPVDADHAAEVLRLKVVANSTQRRVIHERA